MYGVLTNGHIVLIISVRKKRDEKRDTSKTGNSSRTLNLASETGALCHIFRDIDVSSAFPEAALLGTTYSKEKH